MPRKKPPKLPNEARLYDLAKVLARLDPIREIFLRPSLFNRKRLHYYTLRDLAGYDEETTRATMALLEKTEQVVLAQNISDPVALSVSSIVLPERTTSVGRLVRANAVVWTAIVNTLKLNWSLAHQIPPDKWEEIIAGAFDAAKYDEVILTPRSGDYGRDVIAVKRGVGSIKIIGSVKAYKPRHLVKHDDVRALLHIMAAERDTSKAILATTSGFAPRIRTDPFIAPYLPTRLELIDGPALQKWLADLVEKQKQ